MNQLYAPFERPAPAPLAPPAYDTPAPASWMQPFPLRRPSDAIAACPLPAGFLKETAGISAGAQNVLGGFPGFGQIAQLIQQLIAALQQLFGNQQPSEPAYTDATASSTGDPHLAFNGTQTNGIANAQRYDSMSSHADLLDSDSFDGGFQISTTVTQPAANGTTMNKSATITANNGQTVITMENTGTATITASGQQLSIDPGQTLDLGNGETVTKNQDGSLTVINVNGEGGAIRTTLKPTGTGVDITATAHNVDLGGDITRPASSVVHPLEIQPPLITPHNPQHRFLHLNNWS